MAASGAFLWLVRTHFKLILMFPTLWTMTSSAYCKLVKFLRRNGPNVLHVSLTSRIGKDGNRADIGTVRLPASPRPPSVVRLVCISDTHSLEAEVECPPGDILIHCGDFLATWASGPADLARFANWLRKQPHQHKLVCAGNHDKCLDPLKSGHATASHCAQLLRDAGAVYFDATQPTAEVCGLRFFGSSYSRMSNPYSENAAFQDASYQVTPSACDVLITHGPPKGIMDNGFGCPVLRASVDGEVQPVLHVFGHW